jgi:hypothetical protein
MSNNVEISFLNGHAFTQKNQKMLFKFIKRCELYSLLHKLSARYITKTKWLLSIIPLTTASFVLMIYDIVLMVYNIDTKFFYAASVAGLTFLISLFFRNINAMYDKRILCHKNTIIQYSMLANKIEQACNNQPLYIEDQKLITKNLILEFNTILDNSPEFATFPGTSITKNEKVQALISVIKECDSYLYNELDLAHTDKKCYFDDDV